MLFRTAAYTRGSVEKSKTVQQHTFRFFICWRGFMYLHDISFQPEQRTRLPIDTCLPVMHESDSNTGPYETCKLSKPYVE